MPTDLLRALLGSLEDELPRATALRERLHASPEPSHGERTTAGFVANNPRFLPPAEAVGAVVRSRAVAFVAAATTPPEPGPGA